MKIWIIIFVIFNSSVIYAVERNYDHIATTFFGAPESQVASYHRPTYLIFGRHDLKLQFSFKYRVAKNANLYFAHTQTMFWKIYDNSKPFYDISYNPEFYYRFVDKQEGFIRGVDFGYMHLSNGKAGIDSRSLDRGFIRGNFLTKFKRNILGANLIFYKIYNRDDGNDNIQKYLGYWDATFFVSNLIQSEKQSLDLEFRLFSGSKVFNPSQGAYQVGLVYDFGSDNFNPMLYLQYYNGYVENLLSYDKKSERYRLGLMLTF